MNILRAVTMTANSAVLTGLERTADITTSLYLYGSGIKVDSQILSIDNATQITLTKTATLTQTATVEITNASNGVYAERNCALRDVKSIMEERGDLVEFLFRKEPNVTRDNYNSIDKRNQSQVLFFRAYPIEFGPSEKKLEKAGLREQNDVLIYTAMKEWITYGIDFRNIELATRNTVKIQGNTFEVKEKGLSGQFNDTFLYITFGLSKQ
jgi:hypothetical protein